MYALAKVVINISHAFWKCFKGFTFDFEQASACLKQFQQVSFYSIVSVSLAYLTKQGCCSYAVSSLKPCIIIKGQLYEGKHIEGSWMGFFSSEPQMCQNVWKECKVRRPLKTVALAVKRGKTSNRTTRQM